MPSVSQNNIVTENIATVLDQLPAAVTVFDLDANMLYYNEHAPRIVNRKPELLGEDIHNCHEKESSNKRLDEIIEGFKAGNREAVAYTASPYGKPLSITLLPFIMEDRLVGIIHHVVPKE